MIIERRRFGSFAKLGLWVSFPLGVISHVALQTRLPDWQVCQISAAIH